MNHVPHLNRQQTKILRLLRTAGSQGVNSYALRFTFHLIQAPVRIKELKEKGFLITTQNRANRSVDYILIHEPDCDIVLFGEVASARQPHQRDRELVQGKLFDGGVAYA